MRISRVASVNVECGRTRHPPAAILNSNQSQNSAQKEERFSACKKNDGRKHQTPRISNNDQRNDVSRSVDDRSDLQGTKIIEKIGPDHGIINFVRALAGTGAGLKYSTAVNDNVFDSGGGNSCKAFRTTSNKPIRTARSAVTFIPTTTLLSTSEADYKNSSSNHDVHHDSSSGNHTPVILPLSLSHPGKIDGESVYEFKRRMLLKYKELYGNMIVPYKFVVPPGDTSWPEEMWGFKLGKHHL